MYMKDDFEDNKGIEFKDFCFVPSNLDDSKADIQDPLFEVNLGTDKNLLPTFVSGSLESNL